ncbi:SDR family oxidoreductase [Streptomyces durocortorensis]|uniref:SDR family oxidoreductase n=1 Tax=Streptomyces durocortorensis TaxID=2811104 RepID=UPI001EF5EBF6|nr:NAD(P)H-binding protein [Streptomyces durocortorensis]
MILVTGATGNIGRELLRQLYADGFGAGVRALTRDAGRAEASVPDGIEVAEGDLEQAASLKSALGGARSLFLITWCWSPPSPSRPRLFPSYRDTLAAVARTGVRARRVRGARAVRGRRAAVRPPR